MTATASSTSKVMAGCLGAGMEPDEVSELFAAMDVNGDGRISLEEWVHGAAAYRVKAAHDAAMYRPGASRLTTGVTLTFLRDLAGVIAKLEAKAFPRVRPGKHFFRSLSDRAHHPRLIHVPRSLCACRP